MSDYELGTFPRGRKLERPDQPENRLGTISRGVRADDASLAAARRVFAEVRAEDFELDGKRYVDKATSTRYRVTPGNPLLSAEPKELASVFLVRDGVIVFLQPEGSVTETREVGSVGGRSALPGDRAPMPSIIL